MSFIARQTIPQILITSIDLTPSRQGRTVHQSVLSNFVHITAITTPVTVLREFDSTHTLLSENDEIT
jgi:hypothetical protein